MRIALVADTFPPYSNSAAVQLRDLAREFVRQGHDLVVLLPSPNQKLPWVLDDSDGLQVLRLKAPITKDVPYVRRTFAEFLMPFAMLRQFRKSPLDNGHWDGVVWYSPSIFHGPLIHYLKKRCNANTYLIIRDIFPQWAADLGLMKRGLAYKIFDLVARYQYSLADVIGVQTQGNLHYFDHWLVKPGRSLEVLPNWLAEPANSQCSIRISDTNLNGRKIFVYAGNMGVAQGMDILLDLAEKLHDRRDVGFLFVGRGSESKKLSILAVERQLDNVLFYDEINPDEIPALFSQCSAGIVSLDPRHKTHNIPGKFLTYIQNGLPVLANLNVGNDLAELIRKEKVGLVTESNQLDDLVSLTHTLLTQISDEAADLSNRCKALFEREFTVRNSVRRIVSALKN